MRIERSMFELAFGRDVDHDELYPQLNYLDRHTGEVVWLYENDEDAPMVAGIAEEENREGRERVATEPGRYLEIPGLDHGEHHEILRDFLRSDWTDDEERWRRVAEAYSGSIGRWKRDVRDREAVHAFYDFQDKRIRALAEEFLRENGIDPEWR